MSRPREPGPRWCKTIDCDGKIPAGEPPQRKYCDRCQSENARRQHREASRREYQRTFAGHKHRVQK